MASDYLLGTYRSVRILKGRGAAVDSWLTATVGALDYFHLWSLPKASAESAPGSLADLRGWPVAGVASPKQQYRIALPELTGSGKPRMVRFRLDKGATQQTLQVLAEHLDTTGVPWLYLCNPNGGRLPNQSLASKHHWLAA